jgi:hypothetical protein
MMLPRSLYDLDDPLCVGFLWQRAKEERSICCSSSSNANQDVLVWGKVAEFQKDQTTVTIQLLSLKVKLTKIPNPIASQGSSYTLFYNEFSSTELGHLKRQVA